MTDEDESRGRHRRRDALEGDEDPIDALFPIEAPDVEHERLTLADAEAPSRGRAVARPEELEVDAGRHDRDRRPHAARVELVTDHGRGGQHGVGMGGEARDRKSTRLNSSHVSISYAVF